MLSRFAAISARASASTADRSVLRFLRLKRLAGLTQKDLSVCRLGYRDKYILETAAAVAADGGMTLAGSRELSFADAEKYIRSLKGVGPKVANCILLFGLLKYESFPLDVWMKRIMHELYGFEEGDMKGMAAYARENFGEYSGFAQQYLFYYASTKIYKMWVDISHQVE